LVLLIAELVVEDSLVVQIKQHTHLEEGQKPTHFIENLSYGHASLMHDQLLLHKVMVDYYVRLPIAEPFKSSGLNILQELNLFETIRRLDLIIV
jgi:hypothetical protein